MFNDELKIFNNDYIECMPIVSGVYRYFFFFIDGRDIG